jgi:predicted MFS family arabinose efflux permease
MAEVKNIVAPIGLFLLTAGAFGAMATFLPVAVQSPRDASAAMLVASVALILGRLMAGKIGERSGPARLLLSAVLSCAAGAAILALSLGGSVALLLSGATFLGAGSGVAQNDSFVAVVSRLGPSHRGTASTIWCITYDSGLGIGAIAMGWIIDALGYPMSFACLAVVAVVFATCLTWWRPARSGHGS